MKQLEIQTAIYSRLTSQLSEPVYDNVPQDPTLPYVVIGDDTSIPFDTDLELGEEATLTLHIWSRYDGRAEVKGIMSDIYDALHRHSLAVTGADTIDCMFEFSETMLDPDMETRHGVMRFRLLLDYQ